MSEFNQPEKKQARWLALCHAVESLTTYRHTSPVVTLDHFKRGMKYVCDMLEKHTSFPCPHEQVKEKSEAFAELHRTRVGKRKANELQVLFLSGPEPMNDLEVMFELGITPENIWAVEADKEIFDQAVESLFVSGYGIKIYRGGLKQFFEIVPQQFDIIYFDACGPLPSSKPSTLDVLRQLFERQRLAPLGVLITNFSQANQDGHSLDLWAKRLGSWFFTRDDWEDFENDYWKHVAEQIHDYYSNFVTRFVIEFGGLLMPWWRVAALDGTRREYYSAAFSDRIDLGPLQAEWLKLEAAPEAMFFQDSFPAYRRVLQMVEENVPKGDPLRRLFCDDTLNRVKLSDAVWLAYALRNCGDPGFSATSELNKKACSQAAVEALNSFRWIDQDERIFCDEPCPHLLADLLLGLYGFPYHCNVAKQRRWRYVATGKVTPMYLDVFVMDQARYFYDLVPTLPLLVDRLRFPDQWILRVCMDGIFRHTRWVCGEWFYASTLAEEGARGFQFHSLPERESIVAEGGGA
ncbi:MAG: hypothetical protein GX456_17470 [Verrucomicrobia bacterium]|nr:hypothetical protein [Verrucomicrobiota bacterium]